MTTAISSSIAPIPIASPIRRASRRPPRADGDARGGGADAEAPRTRRPCGATETETPSETETPTPLPTPSETASLGPPTVSPPPEETATPTASATPSPIITPGPCTVEATFESLNCRIQALIDTVTASPDFGRLQGKLIRTSQRAKRNKERADSSSGTASSAARSRR